MISASCSVALRQVKVCAGPCKSLMFVSFSQSYNLYHQQIRRVAMAIELTAMETILGGILAFLAGLFGLLGYYKLRPMPKGSQPRGASDSAYLQRLEYYESQMVELKVRLDALRLGRAEPSGRADVPSADMGREGQGAGAGAVAREQAAPTEAPFRHHDLTNHILHLITNKSMTARDIQSATGRTREHTSRQMKRLAEEGLVKRHSNTRPYTYSLTEQGRSKLAEYEGTV